MWKCRKTFKRKDLYKKIMRPAEVLSFCDASLIANLVVEMHLL